MGVYYLQKHQTVFLIVQSRYKSVLGPTHSEKADEMMKYQNFYFILSWLICEHLENWHRMVQDDNNTQKTPLICLNYVKGLLANIKKILWTI